MRTSERLDQRWQAAAAALAGAQAAIDRAEVALYGQPLTARQGFDAHLDDARARLHRAFERTRDRSPDLGAAIRLARQARAMADAVPDRARRMARRGARFGAEAAAAPRRRSEPATRGVQRLRPTGAPAARGTRPPKAPVACTTGRAQEAHQNWGRGTLLLHQPGAGLPPPP